MPGLLIVVASLAQSTGSRACELSSCSFQALGHRFSTCGAWASLAQDMWDLPGPGSEPVCPVLVGGFLTTGPPEKSESLLFCSICSVLFMVDFFLVCVLVLDCELLFR